MALELLNITLFILLDAAKDTETVKWWSNIDWGWVVTAIPTLILVGGLLVKFGRFSEKFSVLSQKADEIGSDVRKNTMTLRSIANHLYSTGIAAQGLFEHNSPITLTDLGKNVLEVCGGKNYIDENIIYLLEDIDKENLSTALDVQNYCSTLLFRETDNEKFKIIKNWVYNNPYYDDINITMAEVIKVMSIYLRDKYLGKYPDLLEE